MTDTAHHTEYHRLRQATRPHVPAGMDGPTGHLPQRTCVGCRQTRAKIELLRIARTPDGIRVDPDQQLPGRGAYVCPTHDCVEAAGHRDGQAVQRALRGGPTVEVHTALRSATDHVATTAPIGCGPHHEEHIA